MKIAISTSSFASIDKSPLDLLREKGLEVVSNPFGRKLTEKEIIIHLQGVDGLLAGLEPLNSNVFQECPQLKAIARVGIGMDNVDLNAAQKSGMKVSNTPDGPTDAVAEMTLAAALTICRNITSSNTALHKKIWQKSIGMGIKNMNILFIGYGRIGFKTAELFRALGARILVCDPAICTDNLKLGEELVELKSGLELANIITLHAGGNSPLLSSKQFQYMKDGVIILNSARGTLIDEDALVTALDSGKVASIWLDVFLKEPYKGRMIEYDQVLLTPHISTYTIQCRRDMEMAAVKNILRDLEIDL